MPTSIDDRRTDQCLSRAELEQYVKGDLSAIRQHVLEQHMIGCALCTEAVEGFEAMPAFPRMDRSPVNRLKDHGHWSGSAVRYILLGALLLSMGWMGWYFSRPIERPTEAMETAQQEAFEGVVLYDPDEEAQAFEALIGAAVELPEADQIGRRGTDTNNNEQQFSKPIEREAPPERLAGNDPMGHLDSADLDRSPRRSNKPSRQLHFLHDLKIVHPSELSDRSPWFGEMITGTPADRPDRTSGEPAPDSSVQRIPYLTYFGEALEHFSKGRNKEALRMLNTVLQQRPDDVNAQFYAGLCYYNLGLFDMAFDNLDASATNSIDSFMEEADWYRALSRYMISASPEAIAEIRRIADAGGFYAERARSLLQQRP